MVVCACLTSMRAACQACLQDAAALIESSSFTLCRYTRLSLGSADPYFAYIRVSGDVY